MADNSEANLVVSGGEAVNETQANVTTNTEINNKEEEKNNLTECEDNEADRELLRKKANQLLLLGKRNILIHDFQSAVGDLGTSCQLFKLLYDEQADEMADPYYYYGKALFELARNESEVLAQDEAEGNDDDDDDEEEEEDGDEGNGDDGGDEESAGKKDEKDCKDKGENNSETRNECTNANQGSSKDSQPGENENGTGAENEQVNDLQLSWEYLELAKLIYQRNADHCNETAVKLAEVYLLLGENGLESENYQIAITDMEQALAIQKRVLPEEDRRIAETFYHLGVAHSLYGKIDEAVTYFKSSIGQLEKKIASLEFRKEAGDKKTEEEEKDAFYTMDGEIESIRSIIKDIEEKISDMKDYKNEIKTEAVKQIMTGNCEAGTSSAPHNAGSASTSSGSSVPATDISHLIRKKRKNESEEENNVKKLKQDGGKLFELEKTMQARTPTPVLHKKQTFGETFCGSDCKMYKWSQTITDLDIIVPVPPEITSPADVNIKTTSESIQVSVKVQNENFWNTIIEGNFSFKTKPSEMIWSLERRKHISIHLEKVKERWWDSLLKDEPKINLEEMELTRPVFDLTEEEEMTLQKIWSKQLEKKNGPERSSHS